MPSASLQNWTTTRLPSLAHVDAQCAACVAATSPVPALIDENLRAYVLLLAAHLQGYCRDLHTECAQIIVAKVRRPALEVLFQAQFSAKRELDQGNANFINIVRDFKRFGFPAKTELDALPGSIAFKKDLHDLNEWRNAAAHHNTVLPAGPALSVAKIQAWRQSCDMLAHGLDAIMYNQLRRRLRRPPWTP